MRERSSSATDAATLGRKVVSSHTARPAAWIASAAKTSVILIQPAASSSGTWSALHTRARFVLTARSRAAVRTPVHAPLQVQCRRAAMRNAATSSVQRSTQPAAHAHGTKPARRARFTFAISGRRTAPELETASSPMGFAAVQTRSVVKRCVRLIHCAANSRGAKSA